MRVRNEKSKGFGVQAYSPCFKYLYSAAPENITNMAKITELNKFSSGLLLKKEPEILAYSRFKSGSLQCLM
jgi:hypothetical protein